MNFFKKSVLYIILICIALISIILLRPSHSVVENATIAPYGDYENTIKIVQESMKAYYLRGPYVRYHNSRRLSTSSSPEQATSQDYKYTVCSGYVFNVYSDSLKMNQLPKVSSTMIDAGRDYYNSNKNDSSKLDGNYLIYYEKTGSNAIKYVYDDNTSFSSFVEMIQPGDIFVFSGHAMIAYDVVMRENGHKDVLLLNSNGLTPIKARVNYSTRGLSYSYNNNHNNGYLDVDIEGGFQYKWLSAFSSRFVSDRVYAGDEVSGEGGHSSSEMRCLKSPSETQLVYYNTATGKMKGAHCDKTKEYIGDKNTVWVDCATSTLYLRENGVDKEKGSCSELASKVYDSDISCITTECTVIRPFYECNNGKTCYNYDIDEEQYKNSLVRVDYPGIYIEKTSNKGDNNSVYKNDEIQYTINIANMSNVVKNNSESVNMSEVIKNYGAFTIEELLDENVEYVSSNNGGTYDGTSIRWNINNLGVGNKIELKYTVRVTANAGNTVVSTGKLYNNSGRYITTGKINNDVIPSVSNPDISYKTCYNEALNANKKGLELIDYVYNCARGLNFDFSSFRFDRIFDKRAAEEDQLFFKTNLDAKDEIFKDMILNNYWGGATVFVDSVEPYNHIVPLKWRGNALKRNFTIFDSHFKDGDVLIYSIDYDTGLTNPYDNNNYLSTPLEDRHTTEKGVYAYIYIDGKFVGVNGSGETARNEFTYHYYSGENLENHLYKNDNMAEENREEILTLVNYETLLDKDYYMILRPEKVMDEDVIDYLTFDEKKVTKKDNVIVMAVGSTVETLTDSISTNGVISITDSSGNVLNSEDILKTNTKVKVRFSSETRDYTIAIKGDVDGDGYIKSSDLLAMRRHLLNLKVMKIPFSVAADTNNDDKINSTDLLRMRLHLLMRKSIE